MINANVDDEITSYFKEQKYKVEYINVQNNSINGIVIKDEKYFFKVLSRIELNQELKGYKLVKNKYPVSKIRDTVLLNDYGIIIFEYDKTIQRNEGLLNDYLLELEERKNSYKAMDNILNIYNKIYKNGVYKNKYPMQKFFDERIGSRLKRLV